MIDSYTICFWAKIPCSSKLLALQPRKQIIYQPKLGAIGKAACHSWMREKWSDPCRNGHESLVCARW